MSAQQSFADDAPPEPTNPHHHKLAAEYSASCKGISCLVRVDGKEVFADYPNGGRKDRAHELASGTKSFCGVLAAAAMQDKLIASWDEKISDTLTEWKADKQKADVTLRHLLSLTSGMGGLLGPVKEMLEQGIRRVTVRVWWDEPALPDQKVEVVTFYTDMRRIPVAP